MNSAKTICYAAYDARLNSRSGLYEYRYWELGESVTLRSTHPFSASDVIQIDSVQEDSVDVSVVTDLYPMVLHSLAFMAPRVPLDAEDDFEFTPYGCDILVNRSVVKGGNKSYITLAVVPTDRMSNICARHTRVHESFNFFINGRKS